MTEFSGEQDVRLRITFAEPPTRTVATFLILFTAVFLVTILVPPVGKFAFTYLLHDTATFWRHKYLWQPLTAIFLHAGPWHLIGNLLFFWFFGSQLANAWRPREFVLFFLFCGVVSFLAFHVFIVLRLPPELQEIGVKCVGASGGVSGLMIAYAMVYGDRMLLAFMMIPMKAKYFVAILFAIEILAVWLGMEDGVAHTAHLAGGIVAGLVLKWVWFRQNRQAGRSSGRAPPKSRLGGLEVME
jgi:membrane associated rhomboid family serine protease